MASVLRTPQADQDLVDIWVAVAVREPDAADGVCLFLDKKFAVLAEQPLLGVVRPHYGPGLRLFPAAGYFVFYRLIPEGIELLHILHAARDIQAPFPQSATQEA